MKTVRFVLTWLCLLAAVAAVLWGSFEMKERLGHEAEGEAGEEAGSKDEPHPLDDEAIERLGVTLAPLAAASWHAHSAAFGRVVDPAPLVAMHGERLLAEAALKASEAEVVRARSLFGSGENISRRALEQAEALAVADQLKLQAVEQRFLLEWGAVIDSQRAELAAELLAGDVLLIRAETASSLMPPITAGTARVIVPGLDPPLEAVVLSAAPMVDPKSQAAAWYLKVEKPPRRPPPGLAVQVELAGEGGDTAGVLVPAEAVLHFLGQAWVFAEGETKGRFERKPLSLDRALAGGWFAADGFKVGEKVVTTGAASLLAEELKSQIEGD